MRSLPAQEKGTYILVIYLQKSRVLTIGSLGRSLFPKGYYLYIGSAQGGLSARLQRHLRREKKIRWHVDYLLTEAEARVVEIWWHTGRERLECTWAGDLLALAARRGEYPRFGSSDCRCRTHLIPLGLKKPTALLRRKLEGAPLDAFKVPGTH